MQTLANPAMIDISAPGGVYYGGSQSWYENFWWRRAGCGPVNASNLMWYLARSRPELAALWNTGDGSRESFFALMNRMFQYVTPGRRGVNTTDMLINGVMRFARSRGAELRSRSLVIPKERQIRPTEAVTSAFLLNALADDLPIAFLNLSNGKVGNLDNWHWVTLIAFDPETMKATMVDQGKRVDIDLGLWLKTTTNGGGFVAFE